MPLLSLLLTALLTAAPVFAQEARPSSTGAPKSASEDTTATRGKAGQQDDLPVSLDKIREGLERTPSKPLLQNLDRRADFRSEVQIQAHIDELLSTLDLKTGPRPPGGLYGYEQQQRLWNSVNNPLMQPYAAFGGGEMLTLAVEALAERYLGGKALDAISNAERARAEQAARAEVARAIAEYCGAQPTVGGNTEMCERWLSSSR